MVTEKEQWAKKVAVLLAMGKTNKTIKTRLGISQPEVSKLTKLAKDKGWLTPPRTRFADAGNIKKELLHEQELRRYLRALAPGGEYLGAVKIITIPEGCRSASDAFGDRAAEYVYRSVLCRCNSVAVSWGRTISLIVDGLEHLPPNITPPSRVPTLFPVSGEPWKRPHYVWRNSSSHVAQVHEILTRLCEGSAEMSAGEGRHILNEQHAPPNLACLPAYILSSIAEKDLAAIRDFIEQSVAYQRIFGCNGEPGLIHEADAVVTSAGPAKDDNPDSWALEAADCASLSYEALSKMTYGNISGVFLPKDDEASKKTVEKISSRWTGITLDHLQRCSQRAKAKHLPGVVIMAAGKQKAAVIQRAISMGLVNTLVVDEELASHWCESQTKKPVLPSLRAQR